MLLTIIFRFFECLAIFWGNIEPLVPIELLQTILLTNIYEKEGLG